MPAGPDRGAAVEATLWGIVGRLRALGWHISLWEIQRAQDVVAYLFARPAGPPSDDELRRHLRPVFCGRDHELATFAEVFRDSVPAPPAAAAGDPEATGQVWRRRIPLLIVAVAIVAALGIALARAHPVTGGPGSGGPGGTDAGADPRWTAGLWWSLLALAVASAAAVLHAFRKRLRRRPASPAPGSHLDLGWEVAHPLDPDDGARVGRVLRARTREPGRGALDVPRTVDATIRAGIRLTARYVEYKRAPEYLAVIEQRSAGDVLAGHYARMVDQLSAQGVTMRRAGLQPRSQLIIDPARGPRRLDTLQPASERERLLLFAPDWPLRDPLTGADRPWLARFDRWAETIRIDPGAHRDRPLRVVDRVLDDVRALDPAWARSRPEPSAAPPLPSVLETGDQVWIEAVPPPRDELDRVMELLATSLGPSGWYWLSACAVYPEIGYELTVALGRLLRADDGRSLAEHLPLQVLARLPWFRHAYMPDWLRASLIATLSRGQLVEARAALDRILAGGLAGSSGGLSVSESGPGGGPAAPATDRVYLEGTALRRRQLAAAAPKPLVAAIRRQRHRLTMTGLPADAPAPRVRRALIAGNALVVAAIVVFTVAIGVDLVRSMLGSIVLVEDWGYRSSIGDLACVVALVAAPFSWAVSAAAGRRRGTVLGSGLSILVLLALPALVTYGTPPGLVLATVVAVPILGCVWTVAALSRRFGSTVVPWATFQRRNRRLFAAGLALAGLAATAVALPDLEVGWAAPLGIEWLQTGIACLIFAGFGIGLGAAYAGGVRIVPVAAAAVLLFTIVIAIDATDTLGLALVLAAPAAVLLAGFVLQLRRFRDRPPPEFWETRWYEWRRPLLVGVPGVAGLVAWLLSGGDVVAAAWFAGIPAAFAVLNAAADRFGAFVARNRLDVRSPFHLD